MSMPNVTWSRRPIGVVIHENKRDVKNNRARLLREWVFPFWPDAPIYGSWSDAGQKELGRKILPVEHSALARTLQKFRCTITFPASGSGWATAKPWECFSHGTVCFFHPDYDEQDHILGDAPKELHDWLRVDSPEIFRRRVNVMSRDYQVWHSVLEQQHQHAVKHVLESRAGMAHIERALGLR